MHTLHTLNWIYARQDPPLPTYRVQDAETTLQTNEKILCLHPPHDKTCVRILKDSISHSVSALKV